MPAVGENRLRMTAETINVRYPHAKCVTFPHLSGLGRSKCLDPAPAAPKVYKFAHLVARMVQALPLDSLHPEANPLNPRAQIRVGFPNQAGFANSSIAMIEESLNGLNVL